MLLAFVNNNLVRTYNVLLVEREPNIVLLRAEAESRMFP